MDPGLFLRERREAHGLSQAGLAALAKTSQGQISRIERGAISPSFETLAKILAALGEKAELRLVTGPLKPVRLKPHPSRLASNDPRSLLY